MAPDFRTAAVCSHYKSPPNSAGLEVRPEEALRVPGFLAYGPTSRLSDALLSSILFLKWELKGKAQAEVVEAVDRRVVAAVSYTAAPGVGVPASAPDHAAGAR